MSILSVFMNEGLAGFLSEPFDTRMKFFTDVSNCFGRKNLKELLLKFEDSSYNDIVIPEETIEHAIDEYCKLHDTSRKEIEYNAKLIYHVFEVMVMGMVALKDPNSIFKTLITDVLDRMKKERVLHDS
ncbi:hypothetical protein [Aeromonas phage AerS_266]|nr:hypothetical protein [Aeromonas phage AerS_266]